MHGALVESPMDWKKHKMVFDLVEYKYDQLYIFF